VFGEGVVNDATSVVLFNAVRNLDVTRPDGWEAARVLVDFFYLFSRSTALGVLVSVHFSNIELAVACSKLQADTSTSGSINTFDDLARS